jgi:hypothetical protein
MGTNMDEDYYEVPESRLIDLLMKEHELETMIDGGVSAERIDWVATIKDCFEPVGMA